MRIKQNTFIDNNLNGLKAIKPKTTSFVLIKEIELSLSLLCTHNVCHTHTVYVIHPTPTCFKFRQRDTVVKRRWQTTQTRRHPASEEELYQNQKGMKQLNMCEQVAKGKALTQEWMGVAKSGKEKKSGRTARKYFSNLKETIIQEFPNKFENTWLLNLPKMVTTGAQRKKNDQRWIK